MSTEGREEHGGSDEADVFVKEVLDERRDAPVVPVSVYQQHSPKKSETGEREIRAAHSLAPFFAHYAFIHPIDLSCYCLMKYNHLHSFFAFLCFSHNESFKKVLQLNEASETRRKWNDQIKRLICIVWVEDFYCKQLHTDTDVSFLDHRHVIGSISDCCCNRLERKSFD